jgi:hypothetical protein
MTFPKNKKPINIDKLYEVSNDNEIQISTENIVLKMGEVIQIQKPKQPVYTEDAWDNIHGDVINFR